MFEWKYGKLFFRCGACRECAVLGHHVKLGETWCIYVKCQACRVRRVFYPTETTCTVQAAQNLGYLSRAARL